jgi:hypothetical protein
LFSTLGNVTLPRLKLLWLIRMLLLLPLNALIWLMLLMVMMLLLLRQPDWHPAFWQVRPPAALRRPLVHALRVGAVVRSQWCGSWRTKLSLL